MLGWLIEIRNFFLALTLAWVGISLTEAAPTDLEKAAKLKPTIAATAPNDCPRTRRH